MPFQTSPDPEFLWLGDTHREAFAVLQYGTLNNYGFLLLTGDVGTGKTTLINALINNLSDEVISAVIPNPNLEVLEFFSYVADNFGLDHEFDNKLDFLTIFRKFLINSFSNNKKVLLIIDESHKLSLELLEEIRLLSNIEQQSDKLINIFFVGQSEIHDVLERKESRALKQRITLSYNIDPFTEGEIGDYIRHRLRVAGAEGDLFTEKAVRKIYNFSKGYPRLINTICDRALLTGYVQNLNKISSKMIKECIKELRLPVDDQEEKYQKPWLSSKRAKKSRRWLFLSCCLLTLILVSGFLLIRKHENNYLVSPATSHDKEMQTVKAVVSKNDSSDTDDPGRKQARVILPFPHRVEKEPPVQLAGEISEKVVESPAGITLESTGESRDVLSFKEVRLVIPFPLNDNEISEESQLALDNLAELARQDPEVKIHVKGYTDTLGSSEYNKRLSRFRANVVKSYLIAKGLRAEIVTSIGMGEENPLKPNETAAGRSANRRVEVELVAGKK